MAQEKLSTNQELEPGQAAYIEQQPSAPADEHPPVYPQLGARDQIVKQTDGEHDDEDVKEDEKQSDSEDYAICEGLETVADIKCIELQPEGVIISPKLSAQKGVASFAPISDALNVEKTAKTLYDSIGFFKGKQKRIDAFTNMILCTNKQQRQSIKQYYQEKYEKPLQKTIEKNFKGIMRELLSFLIMSEEEFIVKWIEVALQKKDINLLTLIICTQSNTTLRNACALFDAQHKNSVENKIDGLTSNIFHRRNINKFLLKVLKGSRESEEEDVDMQLVEEDVQKLLKASKSKKKLKKEAYVDIFTQRSFEHLYHVSKKFEEAKSSLIETVKSLFKESSETGYAVIVVLYFATRKFELFADVLGQTVHEPGPNYVMFLRVIVERCEMDLSNIIDLYGAKAMKNFIELNLKQKDVEAAKIVAKLCAF